MAMYDWNGNGNRNDMADNFIEYQIYKDCTSNNSTPRSSANSSGSSFWELAIELKPQECHKGYGTEALPLLMQSVHKLTGKTYFRARVEIDNHASQGLMKKLGARENGISEFLLHGDEIEKFQEENRDKITDEIRAIAADFCMEAEDILGYVLEYRIDVEKV
ncbi:MAG: GNAT family N-acetyltransferase [Clostridia bacterium]|nr:GNAT family N-acetyltransferase [Clostridia bacterium]